MGIRYKDIKGKFKACVDAALAKNTASEPKRIKQSDMETATLHTRCLVDIDCAVLIRITRSGARPYDVDNFEGGCKALVDAICSAIGKRGDSAKDGVQISYSQVIGPPGTRIEVFKQR